MWENMVIFKEDWNRFKFNELLQSGTKVLIYNMFANGSFINRNPYFLWKGNTFSVNSHLHPLINVETGFVNYNEATTLEMGKRMKYQVCRWDKITIKWRGRFFFQQCFDCIFALIVAVYGSSWAKRVPVLILVTIILVSVCCMLYTHWLEMFFRVHWAFILYGWLTLTSHKKVTSTDLECDLGGLLHWVVKLRMLVIEKSRKISVHHLQG